LCTQRYNVAFPTGVVYYSPTIDGEERMNINDLITEITDTPPPLDLTPKEIEALVDELSMSPKVPFTF
jgi:hypothetical protein